MLSSPRPRRGTAILAAAGLAAFALTGIATAGSATAATTPTAASSTVNPYSPANGHAYRHGVIPTVSQQAKMNGYAKAHPNVTTATGPQTLSYGGGIGGVGVTSGHNKTYLIFYGNQWGTSSTDANGNLKFTGDSAGAAGVSQQMFKGIGTNSELWSADLTQWCDGAGVASGATVCPASGASYIPYQTGGVLSGVWYDNSAASPAAATALQLGQEAVTAATHFGNTTAASNRYAYYVIMSPHGTNPDNYQGAYCAWHDYTGDVGASSPAGNLAFSNQPYNIDSGAGCGVGFVNSPGTTDGFTMTLGHEWHETMSDQFPAGGWTNHTGSAYNGEENSDECAWLAPGTAGGAANISFGSFGTYAEQASWSNDTNNCAISHPIVSHGTGSVTVTNPGNQTGTVGTAISLQMSASGGSAPYTWSATGLPAGLSINASTGLISGTPTTAATYSATVTAKDTTNATGSASFSWTISTSGGGTFTVTNPGNQTGYVGDSASLRISASGGTGPYTWAATGLPPGLAISGTTANGRITGTYTNAGSYHVTVTATDSNSATGSTSFTWTVSTGTLATVNPGNQTGAVGTLESLQLHARGGTGPYAWSATGLPPGLTLDASTGQIRGTPNTAGTYSVRATVTDATNTSATTSFSWFISTLQIVDPGAQNWEIGVPVNLQMQATGGAPAYTWSANNLPAGLSISSTTGLISGTPACSVLGCSFFTVQPSISVVDSTKVEASRTLHITLQTAVSNQVRSTLSATVGQAYQLQATANNGYTPYTWSASNLPPGLSISPDGLISGTPTLAGKYTGAVTVTDAIGATDSVSVTWTIKP
jgi:hypothetical protein